MRYVTKYSFLFLILVFSMFSIVSSIPPVTIVTQFPLGYDIEVHPIKQYFKIGEDVNFHIHIFNSSNGYPVNSSATCYLHLYNTDGEHLFIGFTSTVDDLYDYEINILGGNFTSDTKSYHAFCYNGGVGGDRPLTIEVTQSGIPPNMIRLVSFIILLIFTIGLILFIKSIHKGTDFESSKNKIIKEHKNLGETMVKGILTGLFKNSFIWIYFMGWILVLILREILYNFGTVVVYEYFTLMANVYSLGLILVTVYMIGYAISYMRNIFGILTDNSWGVGNE